MATLDTLEIQIVHKASSAATEIGKVTRAVTNLSNALDKVIPKLRTFNSLLGNNRRAPITINDNSVKQTADTINNITRSAKGAQHATKGIASSFGNLGKAAKKAVGPLGNFVNSLNRIAFYRIIRAIIKSITKAFSEGLEYAYKFSYGITSESHRFSEAMDSMYSASITMKAQLGSVFISLLTIIQPVVNMLINLVVKLADAMSQMFSAFTGGTKYLKAKDITADWADTMEKGGKAAKEWKNQLLGFDEINRLEEPSSGGGSGKKEIDPSTLYEDTDISKGIKDFVQSIKDAVNAGDWYGAGKIIADKINSLIPTREKMIEWGNKLGEWVSNGISFALALLREIKWGEIGARVASFLNGLLESIDWHELGQLIIAKMLVLPELVIGALLELDWTATVQALWDTIRGMLDGYSEFLDGYDWEAVGVTVYEKLKDLVTNLELAGVARSFFSALGKTFGALLGYLWGWLAQMWRDIKEYFSDKMNECGGDAWAGFLAGLKSALTGIWRWIVDNIWTPFINGFKSVFGIHSPAEEMKPFGGYVWEGVLAGIINALVGIVDWVNVNIWTPFCNAISSFFGVDNTDANFLTFGLNFIGSILDGIISALTDIGQWVYDNIWTPIKNKLTEYFGLDNTEASFTVFGSNTIGSILRGIVSGMLNIGTWVYNNIFKKIFDAIGDYLGFDASETNFLTFGLNVIGAITRGILTGLKNIATWVYDNVWMKIWQALCDYFGFDYTNTNVLTLGLNVIGAITRGILTGLKNIGTWVYNNVWLKLWNGLCDYFGFDYTNTNVLTLGLNVIGAILRGIVSGLVAIGTWVYDNIWTPLKNGLLALFGVDTANTNMLEFGTNIIQGLKNGILNAITGLGQWIYDTFWGPIDEALTKLWNQLDEWWQGLQTFLNGLGPEDPYHGGTDIWSDPDAWGGNFASGGFPDEGQLFVAREAGPEMVGTIGGQTAVASNNDILSGIRQGVFEAVSAAMSNGGNNGTAEFKLYLDSREIKAGLQRLDRAWGV